MNQPVLRREVESAYAYAATAYARMGAGAQLRIHLRRESDPVAVAYPELAGFVFGGQPVPRP